MIKIGKRVAALELVDLTEVGNCQFLSLRNSKRMSALFRNSSGHRVSTAAAIQLIANARDEVDVSGPAAALGDDLGIDAPESENRKKRRYVTERKICEIDVPDADGSTFRMRILSGGKCHEASKMELKPANIDWLSRMSLQSSEDIEPETQAAAPIWWEANNCYRVRYGGGPGLRLQQKLFKVNDQTSKADALLTAREFQRANPRLC